MSEKSDMDKINSSIEKAEKSLSSRGGIGFTGALFITFLVLKLTNVINWSWWWVTAPLWIPTILVVGVLLVVLAVAILIDLFTKS